MESRAKLFGHPIHQMLVVLPLGVLAMSLIFDLLARMAGWTRLHEAAFYMIAAGVISGLVAAVFGFISASRTARAPSGSAGCTASATSSWWRSSRPAGSCAAMIRRGRRLWRSFFPRRRRRWRCSPAGSAASSSTVSA
jgi:uncharacterized membrane protein